LFWNLGYHYRYANWNKLPGKPDLVFVKRKRAVFLHGCFWHRHPGCPNTRLPKSNIEFWENKLSKNVLHDELVYAELQKLGWSYLIIWECEMKKSNRALLENRIHLFMDGEVV
jgi:DNA mismatch endonuclease (patch repair protein)